MRMTKQHFEALATALASVRPSNGLDKSRRGWAEATEAIADMCEKSNELFDRMRFIEAATTRCNARYVESIPDWRERGVVCSCGCGASNVRPGRCECGSIHS